jgi:DNA polymerase I-like protein with 3'-5' exonuclease and polymerase domains
MIFDKYEKVFVDDGHSAFNMLSTFIADNAKGIERIAVDTETTGLAWMNDKAFIIGIGWKPQNIVYVVKAEFASYVGEIYKLANTIIYHNSKFDMHFLDNLGIDVLATEIDDTVGTSRLILKDGEPLKLKSLGKTYVDRDADYWEVKVKQELKEIRKEQRQVLKTMLKPTGWGLQMLDKAISEHSEIPPEVREIHDAWNEGYPEPTYFDVSHDTMMNYLAGDVILTLEVHEKSVPVIINRELKGIHEMEKKLIPILYRMERCGVRVNRERLLANEPTIRENVENRMKRLKMLAGGDFNPNSHIQVKEVLTKRLGYRPDSTDKEHLEAINDDFARALLDYRTYSKIHGTYIMPMIERSLTTGRIHTSINQFGAFTGRFSMNNPSLQVIPKARKDYPELNVRQYFIPTDDEWEMWFFDYNAQELRILSDYANDKIMKSAFIPIDIDPKLWTPTDLHTKTTLTGMPHLQPIYDKSLTGDKEAEKDWAYWRGKGKALNFAKVYGAGVSKLAAMLGISEDEARAFVTGYEKAYPDVMAFMELVSKTIRKRGYVTNRYGRRYYVDRNFAYKGTNYLVQGSGADLMKTAMIAVEDFLASNNLKSRMLLTIHDELVLEIHVDETHIVVPKVKEIMEYAPWSSVPIIVEAEKTTTDWANKTKVEGMA